MDKKHPQSFIFYLTLEEDLPEVFYRFVEIFKDYGTMLVPVKLDQLQSLAASTEQSQIIVLSSVSNVREFRAFLKVRSLLKYILKSKRLTFLQLSSFGKLNDSKLYHRQRNYFFLKYPLDARVLAAKITRYHELKSEQGSKWPGGRRAGLGAIAI